MSPRRSSSSSETYARSSRRSSSAGSAAFGGIFRCVPRHQLGLVVLVLVVSD